MCVGLATVIIVYITDHSAIPAKLEKLGDGTLGQGRLVLPYLIISSRCKITILLCRWVAAHGCTHAAHGRCLMCSPWRTQIQAGPSKLLPEKQVG